MSPNNIKDIERVYPNWFDASSELSKDDQQWIWENLPISEEKNHRTQEPYKTNTDAYENENGGYKFEVNDWLDETNLKLIGELKKCGSYTNCYLVAFLLEKIFSRWKSYVGHWLYIAQTYTPRVINWVMNQAIKEYSLGRIKKTPAHCFTFLIQHRSKRKSLVATNGVNKQKGDHG